MRSSAPALIGDFAFIGGGSCFWSTVTGLLGRTALGAKKIHIPFTYSVVSILVPVAPAAERLIPYGFSAGL